MIVYHHPHDASHYISGSTMTQVAIVSVWLKRMNNREGKTIVGTQFLIYSGEHCSFRIGSEAIHTPLLLITLYRHISTMKNRSNLYEIVDGIVPPIVVPRCCNGYHHVSNLSMGRKYPGELGQRSWFVSSPICSCTMFVDNYVMITSVGALRVFIAMVKLSPWTMQPGRKSRKLLRASTQKLGLLVFSMISF